MTLLRCATHTVADAEAAADRFVRWFDYRIVESGFVPPDLAASWAAPASAGRAYALLQPASGADGFVRFVTGEPVESYRPIRTYGWAAIELCVTDVEAVNARLASSPFRVVGPPARIAGLPTIYPMQVEGPDHEVIFLTEILTKAPDSGLPRPQSLIDRPFILVLACADLRRTADWFRTTIGLEVGQPIAIRYSMIARAFDLPIEQLHELVTARWNGEVFLEFDQYPAGTTVRAAHAEALPPGVSITTIVHPDFASLEVTWITPPTVRSGPLYAGRRVATTRTPEGALLELIEAAG